MSLERLCRLACRTFGNILVVRGRRRGYLRYFAEYVDDSRVFVDLRKFLWFCYNALSLDKCPQLVKFLEREGDRYLEYVGALGVELDPAYCSRTSTYTYLCRDLPPGLKAVRLSGNLYFIRKFTGSGALAVVRK